MPEFPQNRCAFGLEGRFPALGAAALVFGPTSVWVVRVRKKVPFGRYRLSHPQLGDNNVETGFLRLDHVRIPRTWLLMK